MRRGAETALAHSACISSGCPLMANVRRLRETSAQARRLIRILGDQTAAPRLLELASECDRRAIELETRNVFAPIERLVEDLNQFAEMGSSPVTDRQKQIEAVRKLKTELAKLRKLVAGLEDRGEPIPHEAGMAIDDISRQIAAMTRKPTAH